MIKSVFGCVVCLCEVILILHYHKLSTYLRDRPFNLQGGYGFLFRSEFFFRTTRELEYLYFFQNLTLDYMTKTLNQIIFFPPPKSEYFFQQHWESEYFFLEKTHTPPRWKLNGPSLSWSVPGVFLFFKLLMSFCISSLEGGSVSISRSMGASGIIASSSGSFRLRTS